MADGETSKSALSFLTLGGPAASGGEVDDDAGEVEDIDTGDTALGMAASDLMLAIKAGNSEGVKEALRDAVRALVPDTGMEL
jgi:hypothetical protein